MNDLFIIANCVVTTVYLLLCFVTDLKERMIYSFPALALSVSWWIVAIVSVDKSPEIYGIVIVHILLYFLLKVVRIWADGDNDLFLLFTAVFAAAHGVTEPLRYIAVELICLVMAMGSALAVAYIEARYKKIELTRKSSVAVAPGFAMVMFSILMIFVEARWL